MHSYLLWHETAISPARGNHKDQHSWCRCKGWGTNIQLLLTLADVLTFHVFVLPILLSVLLFFCLLLLFWSSHSLVFFSPISPFSARCYFCLHVTSHSYILRDITLYSPLKDINPFGEIRLFVFKVEGKAKREGSMKDIASRVLQSGGWYPSSRPHVIFDNVHHRENFKTLLQRLSATSWRLAAPILVDRPQQLRNLSG
jgi:hypothetical protein